MAIIFTIEDGTGLSTANSYATVAEAEQYLENSGRNIGTWGSSGDTEKQAALINAFQYMKARWQTLWIGTARYEDQAGDWPRFNAYKRSGFLYEANSVPPEVKNAQIEYALIAISESLFPNPEYDDTNRSVTGKTDKVGPITETRQFSDKSKPDTFRKYPLADNLISFLVRGGAEQSLARM